MIRPLHVQPTEKLPNGHFANALLTCDRCGVEKAIYQDPSEPERRFCGVQCRNQHIGDSNRRRMQIRKRTNPARAA